MVRVDGIEILVVSIRAQMLDLQQFLAFGIEPEQKRIVALKSMQHFRAAFEPDEHSEGCRTGNPD